MIVCYYNRSIEIIWVLSLFSIIKITWKQSLSLLHWLFSSVKSPRFTLVFQPDHSVLNSNNNQEKLSSFSTKLPANPQSKSQSKSSLMTQAEDKLYQEPPAEQTSVAIMRITFVSHQLMANTSQSHWISTPMIRLTWCNWPKNLKFTSSILNSLRWDKIWKKFQKINNLNNKGKSSTHKSLSVTKIPSSTLQLENWSSLFWSLLDNYFYSSQCLIRAEEVTCLFESLTFWFYIDFNQ